MHLAGSSPRTTDTSPTSTALIHKQAHGRSSNLQDKTLQCRVEDSVPWWLGPACSFLEALVHTKLNAPLWLTLETCTFLIMVSFSVDWTLIWVVSENTLFSICVDTVVRTGLYQTHGEFLPECIKVEIDNMIRPNTMSRVSRTSNSSG